MPQSNSNLQSYAKLPAAKNNSPKIPQISQNISLRLSLMPHTDLSRSHSFARLALNLTEALRTFAPLCLTQIQRDSTKIICVSFWKSEYSEHSEYSDTLHDPSANLCEI